MHHRIRPQKASGPSTLRLPHTIKLLFFVAFTLAAITAFLGYGNSTFLSEIRHIPEGYVGAIYLLGALGTFLGLLRMPSLFERFGNKYSLVYLGLAILLTLGLLSLVTQPIITVILFVIYLALISMLFFSIDANVEHYTDVAHEGTERGLLLTSINVAWLLFPLVASQLLGSGFPHAHLYMIAAILMVIFVVFVYLMIPSYPVKVHRHRPFLVRFKAFMELRDLRHVFLGAFSLQFFYAVMVIYTPLYLVSHIGIGWEQIGIIFLIMLTPFVLLEIPLGRLADTRYGEKEMMILGIVIIAATTATLTFITTATWYIWAIILFISRVGASTVEIMSESYFYKTVTEEQQLEFISVFKNTSPIAYMSATLIATILLGVLGIPLQYLFLITAVVIASVIPFVSRLRDTK